MNRKKSVFFKTLLVMCLALLFFQTEVYSSISVCAEEYSEEEKAAAKAWLSSHGYSPTREGAAQAYQDYLNGKFDDDPQVQAAKQASEQSTTETSKSKKKKSKKKTETSKNNSSLNDSTTESTTTENDNQVQKSEQAIEDENSTENETSVRENLKEIDMTTESNTNSISSSDELLNDNVSNTTDYYDVEETQDSDTNHIFTTKNLLISIGILLIAGGVSFLIFLKRQN